MPYRNEDDARRLRREAEAITLTPASLAWRPSSAAWAALFGTVLTLVAAFAGLSNSQHIAVRASTPSPPPPSPPPPAPIEVAAPATDLTSGLISRQAAALGGRDIGSGTRLAHIAADTLFHLAQGAECDVETRTQPGACEVTVRCGGRTLYSADEAHGLTCIRGPAGVSLVFDRGTTSMDGTPALYMTRAEVTLLDNTATQHGTLRMAYSPLFSAQL